MSRGADDREPRGPEEFLPGSNGAFRWGVRPACDEDDEFLRGLGGPKNTNSLRRGESQKVIEVILEARNGAGRRHYLRVPCRVPADAEPGEALLLVTFTDREGVAHPTVGLPVRLGLR